MKKTSKFLVSALTMAMALPMIGLTAFAADGSKSTPVTYDTSNNIPDPDHPANPEWAVVIPKVIEFTDDVDGREVNADITLISKGGAPLPSGANFIEVNLKSANGFNLQYGSEKMPYTIDYSDGTITGTLSTTTGATQTKIGELKEGRDTITSKAKLVGNATVSGSHEDTLTYTVEKK